MLYTGVGVERGMVVAMETIVWGASWVKITLIALSSVVIMVCLVVMIMRTGRLAAYLAARKHDAELWPGVVSTRQYVRYAFFGTGILLLCIAGLDPRWGEHAQQEVREGRDIIFALDISRSMLAQDFRPSRLEHAKEKIHALLDVLPAERVGLLLFSGEAFLQCPLTEDYHAFKMFLRNVSAETFGSGATAIDRACFKAARAFESHEAEHTKLFVMLTDGEDFSRDMVTAIGMLRKQTVTVVAFGCASPQGGPIPICNLEGDVQGYERNEQGEPHISTLQESFLRDFVQQTGGIYVRTTYDREDIYTIADYIKRFEKRQYEERKRTYKKARFPLFLGTALIFLLLEWCL